jgi:hypothetical protein
LPASTFTLPCAGGGVTGDGWSVSVREVLVSGGLVVAGPLQPPIVHNMPAAISIANENRSKVMISAPVADETT